MIQMQMNHTTHLLSITFLVKPGLQRLLLVGSAIRNGAQQDTSANKKTIILGRRADADYRETFGRQLHETK
jgi:hypothetical protein